MVNQYGIEEVISEIMATVSPLVKHNDTIGQIEQVFRKNKFYTTREYPIFKMKDGSGRAGRIDLVARKGKFRVAIEYDHHELIKWKSFQKVVQIKPDVAIVISGLGNLKFNFRRAAEYEEVRNIPLYVVSLRERQWNVFR